MLTTITIMCAMAAAGAGQGSLFLAATPQSAAPAQGKTEQAGEAKTLRLHKAAKEAPADFEWPTEMITEAQGVSSIWTKEGEGFTAKMYEPVIVHFVDYISELVEGENGEVYLKNPISLYATHSYIRGTREGDTMSFHLPQLIERVYQGDGEYMNLYAAKMSFELTPDGLKTYVPMLDEDESDISFTLDNGVWMMDVSEGEEDWIFGVSTDNMEWNGYGEWNTEMKVWDGVPVAGPSGVDVETWSMTFNHNDNFTGYQVNVAIDGDRIWIGGLLMSLPDGWIEGKIVGDKVVIDNFQYMGIDPDTEALTFFMSGREVTNNQGQTGYEIEDTVEYPFNRDSMTIDCTGQHLILNASRTTYEPLFQIDEPKLREISADMVLTPMTPMVLQVIPFNEIRSTPGDLGFAQFVITEDGYALDINDLYYRVWVDGEVYTFDSYLYPRLDEPISEIPANVGYETMPYFIGNGIYGYRSLPILFYGYETIGVQSVYYGNPSGVVYSDINIYNMETGETENVSGIEELAAGSREAVDVKWFTLTGLQVDCPDKGLYVKVTLYSDGTTKSMKVAR